MTPIEELIEAIKSGDLATARALVASTPALAAAKLPSGESPVMTALYRGHRDLAAELAAGIEAPDAFAAAALDNVAALERHRRSRGSRGSHGSQQPAFSTDFAYDGWTPLHLAAFFGASNAAEWLIAAGADLEAVSRNSIRNTPLHAATAGGHADIALLLIDRGADVTARDSGGHTPLHIAAENGLADVVRSLLAHGADPYAVDAEDRTPLARAAAKNRNEIIDLLNEAT
jgi:ankyrin repeat protein